MAKVFLSYRHEVDSLHPKHDAHVRTLGESLLRANIEVILDQFYLDTHPGGPDEQWPKWCEDQVPEADKVLIIASAGYFKCYEQKESPGAGLGAACETTVIRNTLYACSYVTNKFRIAYFNPDHVKNLPPAINGIHRFDALNPKELNDLISWAGGTFPISSLVSSPVDVSIDWPAHVTGYEPDLANRNMEFAAFAEMLSQNSPTRAIFLEAPSDHGKTLLVAECMHYARRVLGHNNCITIDFKGNSTRETALETVSLGLAKYLPRFAKHGSQTRDLRADLRALKQPIVLLFDTYEKASPEAKELVQNLLLGDLDQTPAVRIIIAGQLVPDHEKAIWANSVRCFTLGPITDSSHWKRYAKRHHPHLNSEQIETVTEVALGHPGSIKTFLTVLSQKRTA